MSEKLKLYIYLLVAVMVQISFSGRVYFLPDFLLLGIIFAGIFLGPAEALLLGLGAGLLRGSFSYSTFGLDIFFSPVLVLLSSLLAGMFYKGSPIAQMFVVAVSWFVLLSGHVFYLNFAFGNEVSVLYVASHSWLSGMATVLAGPPVFFLLGRARKVSF